MAFNGIVRLKDGESQESLLRRFNQKVAKNGALTIVRNRRWFVSRSEQRRIEKNKAIRKYKRLQASKKAK